MKKALSLSIAALFAFPAMAEQDAASAAAPGRVSFTSDAFNPQVTASEKPVMIAKVKAVGQVVVGTPALTNPIGMAIDWSTRLTMRQDGMPASDPYPARGFVLIRKIDLKRKGTPDAQGKFGGEGEGPSIKFTVNDPFAFYWGNIESMHPATGTFTLPLASRWVNGQMTVQQNGETVLVLGRADRAPFVVLTRRQALEATIAQLTADGIPPESKGIQNLRAEIAALAPAQAAEPACRGGKEIPGKWLTECSANAQQQVRRNPDYFDVTKPRTSTQLVTFRVSDAGITGEDKDEGDRLRQAFAQLDLAAVRKQLE